MRGAEDMRRTIDDDGWGGGICKDTARARWKKNKAQHDTTREETAKEDELSRQKRDHRRRRNESNTQSQDMTMNRTAVEYNKGESSSTNRNRSRLFDFIGSAGTANRQRQYPICELGVDIIGSSIARDREYPRVFPVSSFPNRIKTLRPRRRRRDCLPRDDDLSNSVVWALAQADGEPVAGDAGKFERGDELLDGGVVADVPANGVFLWGGFLGGGRWWWWRDDAWTEY